MITYKFRLYPNKEQQSKLWKHANKLNYLYNYFLNQKIEAYEKDKTNISRYDQQKELVTLKQNDEIMKQIFAQVLQQVPLRLYNTYKAFFERRTDDQGFPKFRSCRNFFGICYPQSGFRIEDNCFITTAYGEIKFLKHRPTKGNVRQVYIKTENNKWYISITSDYELPKTKTNKQIGIDVGISNLVATSDREIVKNKTHAKYFDKQINKLRSRRDTNCKKRSREYKFLSKKIKQLYGVKNRKIGDFLHKTSKSLSRKHDTIFVEDLDLKRMGEGRITGLNRELRNSQIGRFISYLKYKTNNIVEVNPMNTSKTCNQCGKIHNMPLYKRTYECVCGYKEDRDINAAKNIYCLGQAILEREYAANVNLQEAVCFGKQ